MKKLICYIKNTETGFFWMLLLATVVMVDLTLLVVFLSTPEKIGVWQKNLLEVSKGTLNWLDNQKDKRGFYYKNVECSTDGKFLCNKPLEAGQSGHDGLTVIWSRFKYYEKTKEIFELEKLKKDLENYVKGIETMEVQNDFWNCKLMHELWKSELIDEETKNKAEKICWTSTYLSSNDIDSFSSINKEGKWSRTYLKVKNTAPEIDLINPSKKEVEALKDENILKHSESYTAYVSDFAARYKWKNQEKDWSLAKSTFNRVVAVYFSNKNNFGLNNKCILGVSAADMYGVKLEKKYLDFAIKIYAEITNGVEDQLNFGNNPVCGVFSNQMYRLTKNKKYKKSATNTAKTILEKYYDGVNLHNNQEVIGGFYETGKNDSFSYAKNVSENGLIVGWLMSM